MDSEVRSLFKQALIEALDIIRPLLTQYAEPYLIWTPQGDGWHGEEVKQPDWLLISIATDNAIDTITSGFSSMFRKQYPEHTGLVGSRTLGAGNITLNSGHIVRMAISELWERHGTLELSEGDIETVVQEFAEFVDSSTIKVRFMAVLANFRMAGQMVTLPRGMAIRRMTEKEISKVYGGSARQMRHMPTRAWRIDAYVIEGGLEEKKLVGEWQPNDAPPSQQYRTDLDRAILALRTFKEGMVGYDSIRFYSEKFCPVSLPILGSISSTPLGNYSISDVEIEALEQHMRQIFAMSEPAMELACSRLADAETRLSPRDRLLDAVIGLEALLLAGLPKEDRRGELRFRFSFNYSTLFSPPEDRREAFRTARGLYDLRSAIAHGGVIEGEKFRIGGDELSLGEAAQKACEVLRGVIHRFLPEASKARYKDSRY